MTVLLLLLLSFNYRFIVENDRVKMKDFFPDSTNKSDSITFFVANFPKSRKISPIWKILKQTILAKAFFVKKPGEHLTSSRSFNSNAQIRRKNDNSKKMREGEKKNWKQDAVHVLDNNNSTDEIIY